MGISYNYSVPTNGLKLFIDESLNKDSTGQTHKSIRRGDDPFVGTTSVVNPSLMPWNRDITELTISVVIHRRDVVFTGYAHHPINMWGVGGLNTAGIILYCFGNFNSNSPSQDGVLSWYFGDYDGTSGGWTGVGVASGVNKIERGEYFHVVLQYGDNYINTWRNGKKVAINFYRPRPLANSTIAGYGQQSFNVYGPQNTSFAAVIKSGLWYNRKCTDQEILDHYKYFARKYPLETR